MNESNIIKQSNLTLCFAMLYLNWFKEFGQNFLENYQKFISHLDHEEKINFGIAVLHFKVFAPRWRVLQQEDGIFTPTWIRQRCDLEIS